MMPGRSTYKTGRIIQSSCVVRGAAYHTLHGTPLCFDALNYAEKVLMELQVPLPVRLCHFWMKSRAQQGSFSDSDDSSIVERCQHLHLWTNPLDGWPTNEECMEWRFAQYRHR